LNALGAMRIRDDPIYLEVDQGSRDRRDILF